MSGCAGCGEPIGHASEIVIEYSDEVVDRADLNSNIQAFGQSECKEIFENHYDVQEEEICNE